MVSPTLGLGPHNLGKQCYLNLGAQKMLGLQVYHQKAQRMGWTKNNKKDDPDANTAVNKDIKKTHVGIYMANPST